MYSKAASMLQRVMVGMGILTVLSAIVLYSGSMCRSLQCSVPLNVFKTGSTKIACGASAFGKAPVV